MDGAWVIRRALPTAVAVARLAAVPASPAPRRFYGVGTFNARKGVDIAGAYFGAFVCRTTVGGGGPSNVLLVATSGRRSVRVVRTLV